MTKVVAFSLLVLVMIAPGALGAEWLSDYGVALRQAEIEGKPLLIILDEPSTRAPKIEKVKFNEEAAEDALLKPYKLCRIDVSTEYGKRVAKAFKVSEVPLTVIIDRTASVQIYRKTGTIQLQEWKATLLTYREGRRPVRNVSTRFRSSRAFCST